MSTICVFVALLTRKKNTATVKMLNHTQSKIINKYTLVKLINILGETIPQQLLSQAARRPQHSQLQCYLLLEVVRLW